MDRLKKLPPRDRLVHWITQRELVRIRRGIGLNPPWTDDEIIQQYRFCNVRRMDDKVSRWLMDNWYGPYKDHPNMLAAVALARFVNKPESLAPLTEHIFTGKRGTDSWWDTIRSILQKRRDGGETVFNGAYMVRGNSPNTKDKITIVVDEYVRPMFEAYLKHPTEYVVGNSMWLTHAAITTRYGYGSFMAGQIVADLRWAITGDWDDKTTWAPMGPGSARGLARLFGGEWKTLNGHYLNRPDSWLADFRLHVLSQIPDQLPKELSGRLEAMDYQNCLCEFDKYERALWGEGRPKQLYRGTGK